MILCHIVSLFSLKSVLKIPYVPCVQLSVSPNNTSPIFSPSFGHPGCLQLPTAKKLTGKNTPAQVSTSLLICNVSLLVLGTFLVFFYVNFFLLISLFSFWNRILFIIFKCCINCILSSFIIFVFFWDKVSLCSLDSPQTRNLSASVASVLGFTPHGSFSPFYFLCDFLTFILQQLFISLCFLHLDNNSFYISFTLISESSSQQVIS
jgi:hypothetical protein